MSIYLSNAFSLNMVSIDQYALIRARKVEPGSIPSTAESVVGHPDTARVLSGILNREVEPHRATVKLAPGDVLFVAQYRGSRLPEGATTLPEGAAFDFYEVTFRPDACSGCPAVDCNNCDTMNWMHGG